jgi:hypothetical protein
MFDFAPSFLASKMQVESDGKVNVNTEEVRIWKNAIVAY